MVCLIPLQCYLVSPWKIIIAYSFSVTCKSCISFLYTLWEYAEEIYLVSCVPKRSGRRGVWSENDPTTILRFYLGYDVVACNSSSEAKFSYEMFVLVAIYFLFCCCNFIVIYEKKIFDYFYKDRDITCQVTKFFYVHYIMGHQCGSVRKKRKSNFEFYILWNWFLFIISVSKNTYFILPFMNVCAFWTLLVVRNW